MMGDGLAILTADRGPVCITYDLSFYSAHSGTGRAIYYKQGEVDLGR